MQTSLRSQLDGHKVTQTDRLALQTILHDVLGHWEMYSMSSWQCYAEHTLPKSLGSKCFQHNDCC